MTVANSEWERRNVATDSTDCHAKSTEIDSISTNDGLNLISCPSQLVVYPNRGDGTFQLYHTPTPYDGYGTADTIVVTFSRPVGMLAILSEGNHNCYAETFSRVVAYGPGNVELGRTTFRLIPTCRDTSEVILTLREAETASPGGKLRVASLVSVDWSGPFAEAMLPIPSGVTRLVISPPEAWYWTWTDPFGFSTDTVRIQHEGQYHIIFRPDLQQPPPTVEIVSAGGPNDGGSFLTAQPRNSDLRENVITLRARVTPAAFADSVAWEVTGMPLHDAFRTIAPDTVTRGAATSFVVPRSNRNQARWPVAGRVNHAPLTATQKASDLTKKSLGFRITAKVTVNGLTVRSQPLIVQQNEIDTIREEYVEFGQQRVLDRTELGTLGDPLRNLTGDYTLWPSGPRLLEKMPVMQQLAIRRFGRPITVMSGYRNPVHHFLHAGARAVNSQHLYGLATDWEITLPSARPSGLSADEWFTRLWEMTRHPSVDGCWEPAAEIIRTSSRTLALRSLNHAHSDWREMTDTSCVPAWRLR